MKAVKRMISAARGSFFLFGPHGTDTLKLTEHCRALPVAEFLRNLTPNAPLPLS